MVLTGFYQPVKTGPVSTTLTLLKFIADRFRSGDERGEARRITVNTLLIIFDLKNRNHGNQYEPWCCQYVSTTVQY